ncbi:MAG: hypothetical protein IKH78_06580 [Ruminococcus sp.]|nr:hypothetical protein [Ruminococcus sp.]
MGVQFWWFYDVAVVAAILVCVFITVKKGLLKAALSFVGYMLALFLSLSISASMMNSINETVCNSNKKKIRQILEDYDYTEELAGYIQTLGYNVYVNRKTLGDIIHQEGDIDGKIYKYLNNINAEKVDTESAFKEKLHEGYALIASNIISRELSLYSAETAARMIKEDPETFYEFMIKMDDPDDRRPPADFLVDTYLSEPYRSQIRLVSILAVMIFILVLTFFVTYARGSKDHTEISFIGGFFSGLIGIFKGVVIVFAIAVIVRLNVVLGSNKMLFFNHEAIDNTYVFKYVYEFVRNL